MIWIPYIAKDYLQTILNHNMRVFEYGCGDSTIFFSALVGDVVSVEHNEGWYNKISKLEMGNVILFYYPPGTKEIGPDKSDPEHYKAGPITGNFQRYVDVIDDLVGGFDLIFIDGRARAACLKKAFEKQPQWIVLDNTERDYYQANVPTPENYETIKFFGHGPKNTWAWETTFFRRV